MLSIKGLAASINFFVRGPSETLYFWRSSLSANCPLIKHFRWWVLAESEGSHWGTVEDLKYQTFKINSKSEETFLQTKIIS